VRKLHKEPPQPTYNVTVKSVYDFHASTITGRPVVVKNFLRPPPGKSVRRMTRARSKSRAKTFRDFFVFCGKIFLNDTTYLNQRRYLNS
jgi:hypothetical protein